ncbi:MAG: dehydrogenase [Bacteroidetes bacterium]|nr:dehydrogenase [Bacteroidota bacterium]
MKINIPEVHVPRVVIVGCGFGGLELAKHLAKAPVQVVLIDKNNYHTFQPLLYQVSTSGLEADSIVYPIRKIFKGQKNFHYRWGEVLKINAEQKYLETNIGNCNYDYLVIATGTTTNFFGIEGLEEKSMPMKTVVEALNLRSLILQNFEKALLVTDTKERDALMNFVVVGGGPTGVELTGALCELKRHVLPNDYPELDFRKMRVILVESGDRLLSMMNEANRTKAVEYLKELGAEVWLNIKVIKYDGHEITTASGKPIHAANLIWAAGVKGVMIDGFSADVITPAKRLVVDEINRVKGFENIFAIGDIAYMVTDKYPKGHPQVAPVAIQQGNLLAKNIVNLIQVKVTKPFVYFDKGSMATVGRNKALVEIGKFHFGGFFGWVTWLLVHLMSIVGFRNRVITLFNWIWNYVSYDRNIRLIIRPFHRPEEDKPAA